MSISTSYPKSSPLIIISFTFEVPLAVAYTTEGGKRARKKMNYDRKKNTNHKNENLMTMDLDTKI